MLNYAELLHNRGFLELAVQISSKATQILWNDARKSGLLLYAKNVNSFQDYVQIDPKQMEEPQIF